MAGSANKVVRSVFLLALLLFGPGMMSASAQRVALLPMADFSLGVNGVNLAFTQEVSLSLQRLGVEMVPHEQVMEFMRRNKVRSFSFLDTFLAKKIGKDLRCVIALLGTITEIGGDNPKLGLSFTALDTVSGVPVWSETGATSIREQLALLGRGEPQSVDDLSGPLLDRLLLRLGGEVRAAAIPDRRHYQLAGLQLFPAYARGRQQIDATLKIRFLEARPNRVAVESSAGRTYLRLDRRTGIYSGEWFAPQQDGQYPVALILEWGTTGGQERVENVASYEVINHPPGLTVEIKNGRQIAGELVFRDHLLILPRLDDLKPLARWGLEIRGDEDLLLVKKEYEGDIPERMVWEGRGSDGYDLADGRYEITLLVWDLAGNSSRASRQIIVQRNAPMVDAQLVSAGDKKRLRISAVEGAEFPLTGWTAGLKSQDGTPLLDVAGEQLPEEFEFVPAAGENTVFFSFSGEDQLGNRRKISRKELFLKIEEAVPEEQEAQSWVPDF